MRSSSLLPLLLLAACASSSSIDDRVDYWRAFLNKEAVIGSSGDAAMDAMRRSGLNPQSGTYTRVMSDGRRVSNCRDPRSAISGKEVSAVRGLYSRYDIEVTVCLTEDGRVEKHYVSAWHQGL